jgi:hypothetical protein
MRITSCKVFLSRLVNGSHLYLPVESTFIRCKLRILIGKEAYIDQRRANSRILGIIRHKGRLDVLLDRQKEVIIKTDRKLTPMSAGHFVKKDCFNCPW